MNIVIHKHHPADGTTLREADCYRVFIDTGATTCGELVRAKWIVDLGAGSEDDRLRVLFRNLPAGKYWVYHVRTRVVRGRSRVTWGDDAVA